MALREDYDQQSFSDYKYKDEKDLSYRKKVRYLLEERIERKRLREEFKDDFDEASDEFDWELLDK